MSIVYHQYGHLNQRATSTSSTAMPAIRTAAISSPVMTPESKHFMAGLLLAAVLIAGIAVELVLVARWFKWPY